MNSKLKPPGSKLKEPARTRGDGEGSSRPPSRGNKPTTSPTNPGVGPKRPSISREGSQSKLPVFQRESSLPQINRDGKANTPSMRREKSELHAPSKKSIPAAVPRGSSKPIITESTPKTVAERKIADRNIAGKGTRSGVSGISDKIMIGDKVLITASNKVGMVQYVGETKFAKGIWAGVVLEDATGKNDGSVSGVRYFTCPQLRGVFVKEEKLEKFSGTGPDLPQTPIVDASPSPSPAQTPVSHNESALSIDSDVVEQDLNVGDEVYIPSANATRIGYLRYIGLTDFAKGTWCGVELQEANGKNDGSVAGTRYFQCEPKYGIFAQIQKVKKCRRGSGVLSPPVSRLSYIGSPKTPTRNEEDISSNSLNPVLQNDTIVPERNLVTPSPSNEILDRDNSIKWQALVNSLEDEKTISQNEIGELKRKLEDLQFQLEEQKLISDERSKESSPTQIEENKIKDELVNKTPNGHSSEMILNGDKNSANITLQAMLTSLQKEKTTLENQVSESKHKIEDLQFQLEEQIMISDEMSKGSVNDEKVPLLETELAAQVEKIVNFESEIKELRSQHENVLFTITERETQLQTKEEEISNLQQIIDSTKGSTDNQVSVLQTQLAIQVEKMSNIKSEMDELRSQHENDIFVMTEREAQLEANEEMISKLQQIIDNAKESDNNEVSKLKSELSVQVEGIVNLQGEIKELQSQHENDIFTITEKETQLETKEEMISNLQQLIDSTKGSTDNQVSLLQTQLATHVEKIANVQSERDVLKSQHEKEMFLLNEKEAELQDKEAVIRKLEETIDQAKENEDRLSIECSELNIKVEEIEILKERNNVMCKQSEETKIDLEHKLSENESTIFDLEEKVMELENRIRSLTIAIEEKEISINDLSQCVDKKTNELAENTLKLDECNQVIKEMKVSIEVLEARNKQVNESNSKLENDIINASKNSGDSAQQLTHLNEQLQAQNKEISSLKDEKTILTAENNSLVNQIDDDKINLESTQKELNEINSELEALKLKDTELKTNYDKLTETNDSMSERINNLENDKLHLAETINTIEAEKDRLSLEKDNVSNTIEQSENRYNLLKEEMEALLLENDNISNIHATIKEKSDQIYEEKEKLEKENVILKEEKEQFENKYNILKDEMEASMSVAQKQEDEKSLAQQEISESTKVMANMNDELASTSKELEELKDQYYQLDGEKSLLSEEKDKVLHRGISLEEKFNKMEAEIAENVKVQDQLKESLDREATSRINKETDYANLQIEMREFTSNISLLENKNSLLEFEVDELKQRNNVLMTDANKSLTNQSVIPQSVEHDNLREGLENLKFVNNEKENEIEFLNSIIVDLQKKNNEQKDKIDILSYGDDAHELNGYIEHNDTTSPMKSNMPMRKFCDICDIFDLHDTEDCPQQSNDFGGSQHHGKRGEERPYCVICETFGHVAENCDEEEMF